MLRDLGLGVSPILAFLLVVLSPLGTGQGAHRDQLLDPLFPHVHLAGGPPAGNAQALRSAQAALSNDAPSQHGPALGAGAGLSLTSALGLGLMPPVPRGLALAPTHHLVRRIWPADPRPTSALADPPPDPPPPSA